jgi:hypothetical protein
MSKHQRQPLSESDYDVIARALINESVSHQADDHWKHRVKVLAKRMSEFHEDLKAARLHREAYNAKRAKDEADRPRQEFEDEKRAKAVLLAQHPEDEPGPWVLYGADQNFDLHGGPHGERFLGVVKGTWKEAVDKALHLTKGDLGGPRIEKA